MERLSNRKTQPPALRSGSVEVEPMQQGDQPTADGNGNEEPTTILSLPTEIRNKIYHELLVTQSDSLKTRNDETIKIDDMDSKRYQEGILSGSIAYRTAYHPQGDFISSCNCRLETISPCETLIPTSLTSYTHTGHGLHTGILSVSRRISEEALYVFYSDKTFHFGSMSAVLPSLNDRRRSWPFIKHLSFHLPLEWHGHVSPKHQEYVCTFDRIATSPTLQLKSLSIQIHDPAEIGLEPIGRQRQALRWLENVSSIGGLDRLTVTVYQGRAERARMLRDTRRANVNKDWYALNHHFYANETKIWCYLAPRMIKAERVAMVHRAVAGFRKTTPRLFDNANPYAYHWG